MDWSSRYPKNFLTAISQTSWGIIDLFKRQSNEIFVLELLHQSNPPGPLTLGKWFKMFSISVKTCVPTLRSIRFRALRLKSFILRTKNVKIRKFCSGSRQKKTQLRPSNTAKHSQLYFEAVVAG